MPKRVVDGDAIWRSMKLKKVDPPRFRAEFANLIPLALANGSFEADPHLIWAGVYAFNRPDVTPDDVVDMLDQFEKAKVLFRWEDEQEKSWGYWVGIDKPGRLPPKSAMNKEKRGKEPPQEKLREFLGAAYITSRELVGGSSPSLRQEVGGGSLGNGKGNGNGLGKGNGNGTEEKTGQQSQQQFETESVMEEGESPLPYTDQFSFQSEFKDVATEPATPPLPQIELDDIRDWQEDKFGISGERLRNCIVYQLDFSRNDWYRTAAEITISKMNSQKFVSKLDADTPPKWTPERATAKANKKPTDSGISKATQNLVAQFGGRINE